MNWPEANAIIACSAFLSVVGVAWAIAWAYAKTMGPRG